MNFSLLRYNATVKSHIVVNKTVVSNLVVHSIR